MKVQWEAHSFPTIFLLSESCALTIRALTLREGKGKGALLWAYDGKRRSTHGGLARSHTDEQKAQMALLTFVYFWSSSDPDVLQNRRQGHWEWRGKRFWQIGSGKLGCKNDIRCLVSFWCPPSESLLFNTSPCSFGKAKATSQEVGHILFEEGEHGCPWLGEFGFRHSPPSFPHQLFHILPRTDSYEFLRQTWQPFPIKATIFPELQNQSEATHKTLKRIILRSIILTRHRK